MVSFWLPSATKTFFLCYYISAEQSLRDFCSPPQFQMHASWDLFLLFLKWSFYLFSFFLICISFALLMSSCCHPDRTWTSVSWTWQSFRVDCFRRSERWRECLQLFDGHKKNGCYGRIFCQYSRGVAGCIEWDANGASTASAVGWESDEFTFSKW